MLPNLTCLLAQSAQPASPGSSLLPLLLSLALPLGVFYFVLSRNNRKQQRERQGFLDKLSKNDRVMTVGGIVGTVVTVRDKEVVLKVDESTNTKMTFMKTAIQQVVSDRPAP